MFGQALRVGGVAEAVAAARRVELAAMVALADERMVGGLDGVGVAVGKGDWAVILLGRDGNAVAEIV